MWRDAWVSEVEELGKMCVGPDERAREVGLRDRDASDGKPRTSRTEISCRMSMISRAAFLWPSFASAGGIAVLYFTLAFVLVDYI